jgi:hypothetical protein
MTEEHLTPEQRRAMLELLEKSALADYPNPERIGCPGSDFLKTLATDRKSIPLSDPRLQHVARCSPCFGEFVKYRDAAKHQVSSRRAFIGVGAAAAAALAAFGIRSILGPAHLQYEHSEIDLLNAGTQRSANSAPSAPKVDLPRKPLDLAITLPFASPTGEYEVQVLHRDGTPTGLKSSGKAYLSNGKTVLNVRMNLSSLPPDDYQLGYRHVPFDTIPVPIKIH